MLETEADRLAMIQAVGELFSTGRAEKLNGVWDCPSITVDGQFIPVKNRKPQIECRESDVALHELVKQGAITRLKDQRTYFVRDIDYDGTGMATVFLGA